MIPKLYILDVREFFMKLLKWGKRKLLQLIIEVQKRYEKDVLMNISQYRNRERPIVQQTLIAVGIKEIGSVWEAGAVGVVVNGPYSWFISSTVTPGQVDGVTHTSISQPTGIAAV